MLTSLAIHSSHHLKQVIHTILTNSGFQPFSVVHLAPNWKEKTRVFLIKMLKVILLHFLDT